MFQVKILIAIFDKISEKKLFPLTDIIFDA